MAILNELGHGGSRYPKRGYGVRVQNWREWCICRYRAGIHRSGRSGVSVGIDRVGIDRVYTERIDIDRVEVVYL